MSLFNLSKNKNVTEALTKSVRAHWRYFLFEGIVLGVMGLAAMIAPEIAGIAITLFLGWVLIIAGIVGFVSTYGTRHKPGVIWSLLSAILAVFVGSLLLYDPGRSLATLTYVLIAYFILDGVLTMILALEHRRELSGKWEWMILNGVLDLIIAGIIISGLPGTLVWAFGLLIGIDMIFGGAGLVAMALDARKNAGLSNPLN